MQFPQNIFILLICACSFNFYGQEAKVYEDNEFYNLINNFLTAPEYLDMFDGNVFSENVYTDNICFHEEISNFRNLDESYIKRYFDKLKRYKRDSILSKHLQFIDTVFIIQQLNDTAKYKINAEAIDSAVEIIKWNPYIEKKCIKFYKPIYTNKEKNTLTLLLEEYNCYNLYESEDCVYHKVNSCIMSFFIYPNNKNGKYPSFSVTYNSFHPKLILRDSLLRLDKQRILHNE